MRIRLGIGVDVWRSGGIDPEAQAHYNRVIADGGIIPSGISGCNLWFKLVKAVYGVTNIATAISAGYDPHYLGCKIGAGSGTTLGQAATKLYSCSDASGDLVQATAASMPLLLVKYASDTNYWFGSGIIGNYCSTPNAAANQITGNIEFIVDISTSTWTPSVQSTIVGKWKDSGGSVYSYLLRIMADGSLRMLTSSSGVDVVDSQSTASVSLATNSKVYLKFVRQVNNGSGGNSTFFYTSTDRINWTQLGSTIINVGITSIFAGTAPLQIGANDTSGALNPLNAKIFRLTIANSIGGTPVVDFNPASYSAATSQTQWTSTTGEVWTINTGTPTTGYKGVLVDRTIVQSDGVDDSIYNATAITTKTSFTKYSAQKYWKNNAYFYSNSSLSFLAYTNGPGIPRMSASTEVVYGTNTYNTLQMFTANLGVSGLTLVNNLGGNSGDLSGTSGTGIYLFVGSTLASFMNSQMSCYIETIGAQVDNSIQRTAMYNAIKSFNNSAF